MDKEAAARTKPHVLVFPFPAPGHINPTLAFAKCLDSKGILVTLISITSMSKSAELSPCSSITVKTISDGSEDVKEPETAEGYFKRFKAVVSDNFTKFIYDQKNYAYKVIVYDSLMPWVLDIARERGLLGASFFTQSCGVSAIYYHLKQGSLRFPYEDCTVSLPGLPVLEMKDLPSFTEVMDAEQTVLRLVADQFSNLEKVDWIFFNTFDELEYEVVKWMASRYPVKTIGPTLLLDKKSSNNKNINNRMMSLFEPDNNEAYTTWLDSKETNSVIYVSFGSKASLTKEQMEELANGLLLSNSYFLWVVRPSEVNKLPPNFPSEKGLIVDWCHQPQVLVHHSVACFLTHCGWNSTLEALSFGVPLIAMAHWADQQTNSKFIEDVWKVGVRVKPGENGIIGRDEIAMCTKKVIEGMEFRRNACKWKELADKAVEKGGTSANNIEDFVSELMCR